MGSARGSAWSSVASTVADGASALLSLDELERLLRRQ